MTYIQYVDLCSTTREKKSKELTYSFSAELRMTNWEVKGGAICFSKSVEFLQCFLDWQLIKLLKTADYINCTGLKVHLKLPTKQDKENKKILIKFDMTGDMPRNKRIDPLVT